MAEKRDEMKHRGEKCKRERTILRRLLTYAEKLYGLERLIDGIRPSFART